VSLCLGPCAEGVVLDRVTWGDLGARLRRPRAGAGSQRRTVCPSQQPFGTAGDFGTPGAPDGSCASPDGRILRQTHGGAAAPPDDIRFPDP
jgi:hypothetical protein